MGATPAIIGRLFDGQQLVKRIHLYNEGAPQVIETNDMAPRRLRELDDSFYEDPSSRALPFSVWERTDWGGTDYLPLREWMLDFGPRHPPAAAIVPNKDGQPVVVVQYADYQRKGSRVG
jgi:hypothetical protein